MIALDNLQFSNTKVYIYILYIDTELRGLGWLRSVSAGFPLSPDLVAKSRKIVTSTIKYNYLMPM